jgi:hypothetical protein
MIGRKVEGDGPAEVVGGCVLIRYGCVWLWCWVVVPPLTRRSREPNILSQICFFCWFENIDGVKAIGEKLHKIIIAGL